MLLSVVSCQDGNGISRISQEPHVHEHGHCILSFSQVLSLIKIKNYLIKMYKIKCCSDLVEERGGATLANSIEVLNVDQLAIILKPWV